MGSEETLAKQSNLFFGLSRMISDGLTKVLPEGALIRDYDVSGWRGQDANFVAKTIASTREMISSMFVDKDSKISNVLYKNANKDGRLRKNLDGRNSVSRFQRLGVDAKNMVGGTTASEKDTSKKMQFTNGVLGAQLDKLQEITKAKGLGFTVVKNADETALTLAFYNPADINSVITASGGVPQVNLNKTSNITIPLADENGVMSNNGMNIVNTLALQTVAKSGHNMEFKWGTTIGSLMDSIIAMVNKDAPTDLQEKNNPNRKLTFREQVLGGNLTEGTHRLDYLKRVKFEGSSSIDTYKLMDEANEQLKSKGSFEEKFIRSFTADMKDVYTDIFNTMSNGLDIENLTDNNGKRIYSNQILNAMQSYLYMASKGQKDILSGQLSEVLGGINDGTRIGSEIEKALDQIAAISPEIDYGAVKEMSAYNAYRVNFMSSRLLKAFGGLNSESKRATNQTYHYLDKTKKAIDLAKKTGGARTQRIVSDTASLMFNNIDEENAYYERANNFQYNVLNSNDQRIAEILEDEIKGMEELKKGQKLSKTEQSYLDTLYYYRKMVPTVAESTVLTRDKERAMFDASRTEISKEIDPTQVTDSFLKTIGLTQRELDQMLGEEGAVKDLSQVKLSNKVLVNGTDAKARNAINLGQGDSLNSLTIKDGKLYLSYNGFHGSHDSSKLLFGQYGRVTNMGIHERFFEALVGNSYRTYQQGDRTNVDIIQENSKVKTVNIGEQIGGRYEYLFDLLYSLYWLLLLMIFKRH